MGWGVDVPTLGATSGVVFAAPAASATAATAATASVAATATSAATAAATAASAGSVFLPCAAVAASLCLAALSWKVIDVFDVII